MRTAAVAALVTLTVAAPAAADHGHRPRVDVPRLAHQVEDAARHVHRRAEERLRGRGRWETQALGDLHRLEDAARHYHRQVEGRPHDARHTTSDFARLAEAYFDARDAVHALGSRHLYDDFRNVEAPMSVLLDVYDPWLRRSHRGYGSGWERGQGDRSWRDRGDRGYGSGYGRRSGGYGAPDDDEWRDGDRRDDDRYRAFPPQRDRYGRWVQPMDGKGRDADGDERRDGREDERDDGDDEDEGEGDD